MFDKFFDCLNVDNYNSGTQKWKPFLEPYRSPDDEGLKWLKDVFLSYLDSWESSVFSLPKSIDKETKNRMILSQETLLGIRMTGKCCVNEYRYLV